MIFQSSYNPTYQQQVTKNFNYKFSNFNKVLKDKKNNNNDLLNVQSLRFYNKPIKNQKVKVMNMKYACDQQKTIIQESDNSLSVNFISISLWGLNLIISSAKI